MVKYDSINLPPLSLNAPTSPLNAVSYDSPHLQLGVSSCPPLPIVPLPASAGSASLAGTAAVADAGGPTAGGEWSAGD